MPIQKHVQVYIRSDNMHEAMELNNHCVTYFQEEELCYTTVSWSAVCSTSPLT